MFDYVYEEPCPVCGCKPLTLSTPLPRVIAKKGLLRCKNCNDFCGIVPLNPAVTCSKEGDILVALDVLE